MVIFHFSSTFGVVNKKRVFAKLFSRKKSDFFLSFRTKLPGLFANFLSCGRQREEPFHLRRQNWPRLKLILGRQQSAEGGGMGRSPRGSIFQRYAKNLNNKQMLARITSFLPFAAARYAAHKRKSFLSVVSRWNRFCFDGNATESLVSFGKNLK